CGVRSFVGWGIRGTESSQTTYSRARLAVATSATDPFDARRFLVVARLGVPPSSTANTDTEETMSAMHESQPCAQRSTERPSSWWQRVAGLIAALALVITVTPMALAQPVEISYNTFLDPNNANDPRAAAQTKMIAEFERQNPNIKVRVVVDPTGANGARTLRTHADSPDVVRATSFQMPEYVATGALLQLDDLVKRDKIDQNDWLLPLAAGMVGGHFFGLQQDYRIPILIYRKHLLEEAKVTPPRTLADVCETGAKL